MQEGLSQAPGNSSGEEVKGLQDLVGAGKEGKVSSVLRVVAESSVCILPVPVVHWSAGTRTSHHVSKV